MIYIKARSKFGALCDVIFVVNESLSFIVHAFSETLLCSSVV